MPNPLGFGIGHGPRPARAVAQYARKSTTLRGFGLLFIDVIMNHYLFRCHAVTIRTKPYAPRLLFQFRHYAQFMLLSRAATCRA